MQEVKTELNLDVLGRLVAGYSEITFDEFCGALAETLGGPDREYASHVWPAFCSNPIGYCLTRNPRSQGERLTEMAWRKAMATAGGR